MSLRDVILRLSDQGTIAAYVEAHGRICRDLVQDYMEEMYDVDRHATASALWKLVDAGVLEQDGDIYNAADWDVI